MEDDLNFFVYGRQPKIKLSTAENCAHKILNIGKFNRTFNNGGGMILYF